MSRQVASRPVPIATAEIRWRAVGGAISVGCIASVFGVLYDRTGGAQAISNGVAAAFGGLVGWAAYHRVSRRNDGLALVGMNLFPMLGRTDKPLGPMLLISALLMVTLGGALGLLNRGLKPVASGTRLRDPLHDAEIDGCDA